jgi:hypothetical protein
VFSKTVVVLKVSHSKSADEYIFTRIPLFKSTIYAIKVVTQEVCIEFVLLVIFIFSYFRSKEFRNGNVYRWLEVIFVVAILLTALAELLWLIYQIVQAVKGFLSKNAKSRKRVKNGALKSENMVTDSNRKLNTETETMVTKNSLETKKSVVKNDIKEIKRPKELEWVYFKGKIAHSFKS